MKPPKGPHKPFNEHEWSFHKILETELMSAWFWELERSLGSDGEPWLALSEEERVAIVVMTNYKPLPLVIEWPIEKATQGNIHTLQNNWSEGAGLRKLHLLDVEWSGSKTKILAEITRWVEAHLSEVPDELRKADKGGRRNQFFTWLVDLAIYRSSEAGITRTEAIKRLNPLFTESIGTPGAKTSPSHWEDAQRRTRERIEERRIERNSPPMENMPDAWKRYYIPPRFR